MTAHQLTPDTDWFPPTTDATSANSGSAILPLLLAGSVLSVALLAGSLGTGFAVLLLKVDLSDDSLLLLATGSCFVGAVILALVTFCGNLGAVVLNRGDPRAYYGLLMNVLCVGLAAAVLIIPRL